MRRLRPVAIAVLFSAIAAGPQASQTDLKGVTTARVVSTADPAARPARAADDQHATLPLALSPQGASAATISRTQLELLEAWMDAVEQHENGTLDDPVQRISRWSRQDLEAIRRHVATLLASIRDPDRTRFVVYRQILNTGLFLPTTTPAAYSRSESETIRRLASAARARGDANRLAKRGALLHSDIAILSPADGRDLSQSSLPGRGTYATTGRAPRVLQDVGIVIGDTPGGGATSSVGHWQLARWLMNLVTASPDKNADPQPSADSDVRQWYQATTAFMLATQKLDLLHLRPATAMFSGDGYLQYLIGSVHELLAEPRIQESLRSTDLRSFTLDVQPARDELRLAETHLRRAIELDSSLIDARIRLGRVLTLRGRHNDAVRELQAALAAAAEPLHRYFGELFLARALENRKELAAARLAYERAAAQFPDAQTPRIALSHLATLSGDAGEALAILRTELDARSSDEDPRWVYHAVAGSDAGTLLADMWQRLPPRSTP